MRRPQPVHLPDAPDCSPTAAQRLLLLGVLVWLGLFAATAVSRAQSPDLERLLSEPLLAREHFTVEDGLPVSAINDVLQSRDGYLWIATYDGLVRFDGDRFTVYRSAEHAGLPSNRMIALHEGPAGALWVLTAGFQLVRFEDKRSGGERFGGERFVTVSRLRTPNGRTATTELRVYAMGTRPDGRLWFGTQRGLAYAPPNRSEPALVAAPVNAALADAGLQPGQVLSAAWHPDGTRWLGTLESGLLRVAPDGAVRQYGRTWAEVGALHIDAEGHLWAGTYEGAYRLGRDGDDPVRLQQNARPWTPAVLAIRSRTAADGTTRDRWFITPEGTFVWKNGTLQALGTDASPWALGDEDDTDAAKPFWIQTSNRVFRDGRLVLRVRSQVETLLHDREGNTWVGTAADGLYRLRSTPLQTLGPPEGLASRAIYPVAQTQSGAVWMGGLNGSLTRVAGATMTAYRPGAGGFPAFGFIWALHEDADSGLWVGGTGLCRLDGAQPGARCRHDDVPLHLHPPRGPDRAVPARPTYAVRAIHEDVAGRLWVGTNGGLFRREADCSTGPSAQPISEKPLPASAMPCWTRFGTADGFPQPTVRVIHEQQHRPGTGTL